MITLSQIQNIITPEAEAAEEAQRPRHLEWDENYALYRNRVKVNRLTQRQSVNVPMMKTGIKSALKEVDDMIDLYFRNNNNDKQKEVFMNGIWQEVVRDQKLEVQDIVDKKQVMQYGISSSQWNIENGKIVFDLDDPYDVFYSPFTNPLLIDDTCRYMDHRHIFVALDSLQGDSKYAGAGKVFKELREFYSTMAGVVKSNLNNQSLYDKNQRRREMGYTEVDNISVGQTVVELNLHWIKLFDEELGEDCIYYAESVDGKVVFVDKNENVIGKTSDNYWRYHFPKTPWSEDVERNDMYPDGTADTIRPLNKLANTHFSQDAENRVLRNFGMNYYNSSNEDFVPQTFVPEPGGWFPVPLETGQSMSDVMQNVQVPELPDTFAGIQFIVGMADKAVGVSNTQAGQINQQKVTLGEVELVLEEGKDKVKAMEKFYRPAWVERGVKFFKMLEANADRLDAVIAYKKGYNDNMFEKVLYPQDYIDGKGYTVEVTTKSQLRTKMIETLNSLNAARSAMPDNPILLEIYETKILEFIPGLTPEQTTQVIDFQKRLREDKARMMQSMGMVPGMENMMQPGNRPMLPAQVNQPQQVLQA